MGSIESFRHGNPVNFILAGVVGVSISGLTLSHQDSLTKFLGLLAICTVPGVILQSRQIPISLAFKGNYEKAFLVQRWIRFLPDCGEILRGWILIEAGRYEEARRVLVNQAFDAKQRPLPFSFYLVLYGYALGAEGLLEEAIDILECGYRAAQGFGNYGMELASCLLAKGIDAKRATDLVEGTMAICVFNRDADRAHAFGLHAYALASNGQLDQAKIRLQEASALSIRCKPRDQAFTWVIMGATYRASGDGDSARKAFQEAVRVHPFGDVRLRAEKWLRLLSNESNAAV